MFRKLLLFLMCQSMLFFFLSKSIGQTTKSDSPPVRFYAYPVDPGEHPDYLRYCVQPPRWTLFDYQTQLISLRTIHYKGDPNVKKRIMGTDFEKTLDAYLNAQQGRIISPLWTVLHFTNLEEFLDLCVKRKVYITGLGSNHIPGGGAEENPHSLKSHEYEVPTETLRLFQNKMGDRWFGIENGEQDGRYMVGSGQNVNPQSRNRVNRYLDFQRYFEKIGDDLGNKMNLLVISHPSSHYLLKEGNISVIAAETAQSLPNSQLYYSWVRGAGKQYGVLWCGFSSIYNRWGHKNYNIPTDNPARGPQKGTSLSLLKRNIYSQILYNCVGVGFESGSFYKGSLTKLTPIGELQKNAGKWLQTNGMPGIQVTQVALMKDFYNGWIPPRFVGTTYTWRVWGNIPYEPGDYLFHHIYGLLYPGYEDSSYFRDESGFVVETPYGDTADVLLSDAPVWLLNRYPFLLCCSELRGGEELHDKLLDYVREGGQLVLTAGNLKKFTKGLAGVTAGESIAFPKNSTITLCDSSTIKEEYPFELSKLNYPPSDKVSIPAYCSNIPAAIEMECGRGRILFLASPFALSSERIVKRSVSQEDQKLPVPYPLLTHARILLGKKLDQAILFDVGTGLSSIICRKAKQEYTIGIINNNLHELPFEIKSRIGDIESIEEIPIDRSERSTNGFLPEGFERKNLGIHRDNTFAGMDIRIFSVKLRNELACEITHIIPQRRNEIRYLPLYGTRSIKEEILIRPTFFEHYDGVKIDWRYLQIRTPEEIKKNAGWLKRHKVRIIVDLTSGLNVYPDLRLVNNNKVEYEKSMKTIMELIDKMELIGAKDLLVSIHRYNYGDTDHSKEDWIKDTIESLKKICRYAATKGMTISFRSSNMRNYVYKKGTPLNSAFSLLREVKESNFKIAPCLFDITTEHDPNVLNECFKNCSMLLATAPLKDESYGYPWASAQEPLSQGDVQALNWEKIQKGPCLPVVFDAWYETQDDEYRDLRIWKTRGSTQ